jgi:hypothetical protein
MHEDHVMIPCQGRLSQIGAKGRRWMRHFLAAPFPSPKRFSIRRKRFPAVSISSAELLSPSRTDGQPDWRILGGQDY